MTPEERAKEVVSSLGVLDEFIKNLGECVVATHIRKAVEESQEHKALVEMVRCAVSVARKEAYEDAAKIAETTPIHWVYGSTVSGEPKHAGECVAQAIRARAAEVAK